MPGTFGDVSVIVATSSGCSGERSRWRSPVPCSGLPALSYQNSLICRPTIELVADMFFTWKVVTMLVPSSFAV